MDNNFDTNGFIIDLSDAEDTTDIINRLSDILELPEAHNKKIQLKLGNVDLNKSQLLSVKALLSSMNSDLAKITASSECTKEYAQALNIETETAEEVTYNTVAPQTQAVDEVEETQEEEIADETESFSTTPISSEVDFVEEEDNSYLKEIADEIVTQSNNSEEVVESEEVDEDENEVKEIPQAKFEQREVEEDLPNEIIETQEEKIETDYELFNPKEEITFEKDEETKEDSDDDEGIEEETPEMKERREMEEEIAQLPTLYIKDTLRSGQTMSYDGNVVIVGDVHPGSEIIAKGDITIWGVLGGIAHAGASGNDYARIRALKMNAIQLRISGYYARRPDSFNIPYIQRTNEFTPEEARVEDEQIAIYKIYD